MIPILRIVRGVLVMGLFLGAMNCAAAASRVLDKTRYHLGTPGFPEWEEFAGKTPHGRQLDLRFQAQANATEQSLFIRQRDVKQGWQVQLNGKRIGYLVTVETELVNGWAVPPGALREGENVLSIIPPKATDDIVVGEFRLEAAPLSEVMNRAHLAVEVTDAESKGPLPCRVTIVDGAGAFMPLRGPVRPTNAPTELAVRNGVVYAREGAATVGLLPGDYTVYASRGFEYGVSTQRVSLVAGKTEKLVMQIRREVPTPGWVACDTHIHTLTYSGHGDATLEERMITIAGEGIELPIATDHNRHVDYSEAAARTRLQSHFTSVIGNEVTTKAGHFNAFPVTRDSTPPDYKLEDWGDLLKSVRGTPGVQVVTLNHPRDLHSGFIPLGPTNFNPVTGEHVKLAKFNLDAIEVITSGAMQSDIMLLYRDWFALLNRGSRVAAVGSSDTHDVSRFILGQGRTYVACDDRNPAAINIDEACRSFKAGKLLVSLGLFTNMKVNGKFGVGDTAVNLGAEIEVEVTVLGPSWVTADRVELYANGVKIREQAITATTAVEKAKVTWRIPKPEHDGYLVAIATGPGTRAPFWEIPRPYQPSSTRFEPRVIGSTNPIWLDGDGK